jgi:hypothetical protein
MDNVNVTVLTDDLGLQREYREVKREATLGERIKIVAAWSTGDMYDNGDIFTADRTEHGYDGVFVRAVENAESGNPDGYIALKEFVVLEPSDIVIIDNQRHHVVEQKANVGERVVVTYARRRCFSVGDVLTVTRCEETAEGKSAYSVGQVCLLRQEDSRVLEPVEDSAEPAPDHSAIIDGLTDTCAKLTLRVTELERKVERQSAPKTGASQLTEAFDSLRKHSETRAKTRDEIVELAKNDVVKLLSTIRGINSVDFVINQEKRTVVALCKALGIVLKRGKARCAPDDCFNVHIGKATSLRRALGLDIPKYYGKAPEPTEVRVGDIVRSKREGRNYAVSANLSGGFNKLSLAYVNCVKGGGDLYVIDDSRDESGGDR